MGKDLKGKEIGKGFSQRKDGLYMGRFTNYYGQRQTLYDPKLKELRKKIEQAKIESQRAVGIECSPMTVTEWFEMFVKLYKENKVKGTTLHRIYQTYAPCKKDPLGVISLENVKAIHVQSLINKLQEEGYSYGSLKLLKSLLNDMFKKAAGNGYMKINPCDAVSLPKKNKTEQRYLTEREQKMFMEIAKEYQHYDIFCINLSSGMRIGEVLGLKWSDIDFEKKTVSIKRTLHYSPLKEHDTCHFHFTSPKTESSERNIPLLPELEKVFRHVKAKQSRNRLLAGEKWKQEAGFEDMVFTSQYGAPIRYGDVNRTIKKVVVKANIQEEEVAKYEGREAVTLEEFSPHCFRHSFITRCREKGIPYEIIQAFVGHSTAKTTMGYDHYKPELDLSGLSEIQFLNVV